MRLGFLCFVGTGHLYPAITLGRCLAARGHDVTIFHSRLARTAIQAAGLQFRLLDGGDSAPVARWSNREDYSGRFSTALRSLASREVYAASARKVLGQGVDVVGEAKLDALIVDQAEFAGGTLAELLGLPFVTLSTSPVFHLDDRVPPTLFGWRYHRGPAARLRNRLANWLVNRMAGPILAMINDRRRAAGLPALVHVNQTLSRRALISHMPRAFDFPLAPPPANLFYTGPFLEDQARRPVRFPWDRLDGRRVVYASMGTVRNDLASLFPTIAEACRGLDAQLVLSLGGGQLTPEDIGPLPGDPLVVHYAPQLELLKRADLTITHAGLNTTLESLSVGVPLVAVPLADDQPGVASRIEWTGVGRVVRVGRLSEHRLREAVVAVLDGSTYRSAAKRMEEAIRDSGGVQQAADIVEGALSAAG